MDRCHKIFPIISANFSVPRLAGSFLIVMTHSVVPSLPRAPSNFRDLREASTRSAAAMSSADGLVLGYGRERDS